MSNLISPATQTNRCNRLICALLFTFGLVSTIGCGNWNSNQSGQLPPINKSSTWWDSNKQELRVVPVGNLPNADGYLGERNSLPNSASTVSSGRSNLNWTFWGWLAGFFSLSYLVLFGGIFLLLAILIIVILQIRRPMLEMKNMRSQNMEVVQRETAKIAELPFELEISEEGFLATAKKYARDGQYDKAIVYLFSHVLVDLDHRKFIILRRGKTNRMLVRELRPHPKVSKEFQYLVLAFERVFFGRHSMSAAEFEECLKRSEVIVAEPFTMDATAPARLGPAVATALIGLQLVLFTGCQKLPEEEYGVLQENESESLAGFSVFQQLFNDSGRRTVRVDRLSPRLKKFGTIVWAPDSYAPPTPQQCAWIDNWLSNNSGSTFIYVGRDYSPGSDYWKQSAESVSQNLRLPYLKQASRSTSTDDADFINRSEKGSQYSRWFIREATSLITKDAKVSAQSPMADQQLTCDLKIRGLLVPVTDFSPEELHEKYADQLRSQVDSDVDVVVELLEEQELAWDEDYDLESTGQNDDPTIGELAEEKYQAMQESKKISNAPTTTTTPDSDERNEKLDRIAANSLSELVTQPLYSTDEGTPLIYEVASDSWDDSKLLVVNNASLCCNYSLVDKDRRKVAMSIIDRTRKSSRAAFLSTENPPLRYSNPPTNDPFGLALFTIYPLNIILIHCLIFGIGALIVMWPIFGRPQTNPEDKATDFGRHIEAFGQLLRKTKDRSYALQLIGRYFREIRRDSSSDWSSVDNAPLPEKPS